MLKNDEVLTSESGKQYTVADRISSGTGQGDVYRVFLGDQVFAMKIFHDDDSDYIGQIHRQMQRGKVCDELVTPIDVINDGKNLGYIMEYITEDYLPGSILYNGIQSEDGKEELPFAVKITALYNISKILSYLFSADLAITDVKFDNCMVNPNNGDVKIFDTDTVIRSENGKSFVEGTLGFMPPLTMLGKESPDKYNDCFALAVMIFMTLMGSHPLMGRMADKIQTEDPETYLFAKRPVYVWHPVNDSNRPDEDNEQTTSKLMKYPEVFIRAMEKTFVDGLYRKEKRTTPSEWCDVLDEVYSSSYCCFECGEEHFFGDGIDLCTYCGSPLKKPLFIMGDRRTPMFLGNILTESDLWQGSSSKKPLLKIVGTDYNGKYGLLCQNEGVILEFDDGEAVEFPKGKVIPLFTQGSYKIGTKSFMIREE